MNATIHRAAIEAAVMAFQADVESEDALDPKAVVLYRLIRALIAAKEAEISRGLIAVVQ